jgi:prophage antirepressor-like protein
MDQRKIVPFLFEGECLVRVVERDSDPWFVAADVCRAIGISNVSDAAERLDEDEKGIASTDTLRGQQEMLIISEGGLYTLILRSRQATTPGTVQHRFRKWVTGEVLPAIRKTGKYEAPQATDDPEDLTTLPITTKARVIDCTRMAFGERAAQQIAYRLGWPRVPAMDEALRQSVDLFQTPMAPPPGSVTITVSPAAPPASPAVNGQGGPH